MYKTEHGFDCLQSLFTKPRFALRRRIKMLSLLLIYRYIVAHKRSAVNSFDAAVLDYNNKMVYNTKSVTISWQNFKGGM